jgi:hypothetical protein
LAAINYSVIRTGAACDKFPPVGFPRAAPETRLSEQQTLGSGAPLTRFFRSDEDTHLTEGGVVQLADILQAPEERVQLAGGHARGEVALVEIENGRSPSPSLSGASRCGSCRNWGG